MKKNNGSILLTDMIIFCVTSCLLLSVSVMWKSCISNCVRYQRISTAVYRIDDYMSGKDMSVEKNITTKTTSIGIGNLVELQYWEDAENEQIMVNLFKVEKDG